MRNTVRLVAIVTLVLVILLLWMLRVRQPTIDAASAPAQTSPATATRTTPASATDANAEPADNQDMRRFRALRAAVNTLHEYLSGLPAGDRQRLSTFWERGRLPDASGDADLHQLANLRAFRIKIDPPRSLDKETNEAGIPDAVEIPVSLQASLQSGEGRTYTGWYRMRRSTTDDRWQITSANITPKRR